MAYLSNRLLSKPRSTGFVASATTWSGSRHAARAAVAQGELRGRDLPVGGKRRTRTPEPESARRGAGGCISQADAPRRVESGVPQPRLPPLFESTVSRWSTATTAARSEAHRCRCSTSSSRRTTTGLPSTSSRWSRVTTSGAPTSCSSSTGYHSPSSSSRTRRTRTRPSEVPGSSSGPTRRSSPLCSPSTRCSPSRTASRPGSARSPPGGNGSSPGAPSPARSWPRCSSPSSRWQSRGRSRSGASSRSFATSSCSRTTAADGSRRRWRATTSFHAVETASARRAGRRAASGRDVAEEPGRYESGRKPGGGPGDRRIGVVWHTQGSGKSLTMAFYAGRIVREPAMANPTVVVLTDRNDLDDQLFGTFARCRDLLRQPPVQADSRADLRRQARSRGGRRRLHHHPEVLPGREGRPPSPALGTAQHRGHRRRGAPQPVRLHRRLRAAHARRAAERLVHRLHRHADRASGRQHAGCVRRLHQHLRHPARGRGPGDGADLLREPAREARPRRARAAQDRPRIRGGDRGRGGRAQGEAQDEVGAARSRCRDRATP